MKPRPLDPIPRAILFDLDDTLCDYSSARDLRLRIALSRNGAGEPVAWAEDVLREMIEVSISMHPHGTDHFEELLARYGVSDPAVARSAVRWYRDNRFHGLELFPGAIETLRAVRTVDARNDTRRPIGIITNGPTEVQRAKLDLLDLHQFVDVILISEDFGAAKPDPSIFREALNQMGVSPGEAVFVGDAAEFDIAGARSAGLPSIWINRRDERWNGPGPEPDRTVRQVTDVPNLVGSSPVVASMRGD